MNPAELSYSSRFQQAKEQAAAAGTGDQGRSANDTANAAPATEGTSKLLPSVLPIRKVVSTYDTARSFNRVNSVRNSRAPSTTSTTPSANSFSPRGGGQAPSAAYTGTGNLNKSVLGKSMGPGGAGSSAMSTAGSLSGSGGAAGAGTSATVAAEPEDDSDKYKHVLPTSALYRTFAKEHGLAATAAAAGVDIAGADSPSKADSAATDASGAKGGGAAASSEGAAAAPPSGGNTSLKVQLEVMNYFANQNSVQRQRQQNAYFMKKSMKHIADAKASQKEMKEFANTLRHIEEDAATVRRKWKANTNRSQAGGGGDAFGDGDDEDNDSETNVFAETDEDEEEAAGGGGGGGGEGDSYNNKGAQEWVDLQRTRAENLSSFFTLQNEVRGSERKLMESRVRKIDRGNYQHYLLPGGTRQPTNTDGDETQRQLEWKGHSASGSGGGGSAHAHSGQHGYGGGSAGDSDRPPRPQDVEQGEGPNEQTDSEISWGGIPGEAVSEDNDVNRNSTGASASATANNTIGPNASSGEKPGVVLPPIVRGHSAGSATDGQDGIAHTQDDEHDDTLRMIIFSAEESRKFASLTKEEKLELLLQKGNGWTVYGISSNRDGGARKSKAVKPKKHTTAHSANTNSAEHNRNDAATAADDTQQLPFTATTEGENSKAKKSVKFNTGAKSPHKSRPDSRAENTPSPPPLSLPNASRSGTVSAAAGGGGAQQQSPTPATGTPPEPGTNTTSPSGRGETVAKPFKRPAKGRKPLPVALGVANRYAAIIHDTKLRNRKEELLLNYSKSKDIEKTCDLLRSLQPLREELLERDIMHNRENNFSSVGAAGDDGNSGNVNNLLSYNSTTAAAGNDSASNFDGSLVPSYAGRSKETTANNASKTAKASGGLSRRMREQAHPALILDEHRRAIFSEAERIDDIERKKCRLLFVDVLEELAYEKIVTSSKAAAAAAAAAASTASTAGSPRVNAVNASPKKESATAEDAPNQSNVEGEEENTEGNDEEHARMSHSVRTTSSVGGGAPEGTNSQFIFDAVAAALAETREILQSSHGPVGSKENRQTFASFQEIVQSHFNLFTLLQWSVQEVLFFLARLFFVSPESFNSFMSDVFQKLSSAKDYEAKFRETDRTIKDRQLTQECRVTVTLHAVRRLPRVEGTLGPNAGTAKSGGDLAGTAAGGGTVALSDTVPGANTANIFTHEPEYAIRIKAERQLITSSAVPAGPGLSYGAGAAGGAGGGRSGGGPGVGGGAPGKGGAGSSAASSKAGGGSADVASNTKAKRTAFFNGQTFKLHLYDINSKIHILLLRSGAAGMGGLQSGTSTAGIDTIGEGTFSVNRYEKGRRTKLWLPLRGETELNLTIEVTPL